MKPLAMSRQALASCLILLGPALAAGLPTGIVHLELEAPRPYGYVIGDLIEMTVAVEVAPGVTLDASALPETGPVNRWLNLRRIDVASEGRNYRLHLQYQTFYAPLEVKNLSVPGFDLRFGGPAGEVRAGVPAWPFTMAPIRELSVLRTEGLAPMRPDAWPQAPGAGVYRTVFAAAIATATLAIAGLGYLRGWRGLGSRGRHFAAALKALRGHDEGEIDAERLQQAYAAVHEAFNRTLGETLFLQRLDEFMLARPHYQALQSEIEAFFNSSYRLFFGGSQGELLSVSRLRDLCRACLRLERTVR